MRHHDEFAALFDRFVGSYLQADAGRRHLENYAEGRRQGKQNFQDIVARRDAGEDITDLVLRKLLPHADTQPNRESDVWIHTAPAVTKDIRSWFEDAGWTKPEDWPRIAHAILELVERVTGHPDELAEACAEFAAKPYTKGFQAGMLSPILNSLQPDTFLVINSKPLHVIRYFTGRNCTSSLTDYPEVNATGWELVDEVSDLVRRSAAGVDAPVADLVDIFSHWLVAIEKFDFAGGAQCWKIAPGEGASQWESCREGGYIAIGWGELGDLSKLSYQEYKERFLDLYGTEDDQPWRFANQISEGDRIVANEGTTTVLGIGTVTGPYYYVEGEPYPHRLPVSWDDTTRRRVNEGSWGMTLQRIASRKRFEQIINAEPIDTAGGDREETPATTNADYPFSTRTFELLAGLTEQPRKEFYLAHKDEFKEWVEGPVQELFAAVAGILPEAVLRVMETESKILARILKNDYGQGGAWDFYWGAFYPKGGKRTEDAQLFIWLNREILDFGFHIGEYGSVNRERFLRNCREHREVLPEILARSIGDSPVQLGSHDERIASRRTTPPTVDQWREWLRRLEASDIGAGVTLRREEVLDLSAAELRDRIATTFVRLFPLVLLATSSDPLPAIRAYIEGVDEEPINPEYSLVEVAEETGLQIEVLERWVRAIERKGQAILYGPPGTGKTYVARHLARHLVGGTDGIVEIVQFHPAYAYEDFVQGIRPRARSEGGLDYPLVPGRLLEFCERARAREGTCVLIIDEINRANLSRVFGELMYLLEYREEEIPLAGGIRFAFPENVRIIGTMNTADRSIALVDHALRRRFAFLSLQPNYGVLERYHAEKTHWDGSGLVGVLRELNRRIDDPHYEVGTSFFLREDIEDQIADIWTMEIEPFLEEYFFDKPEVVEQFRWSKVRGRIESE